MHAPSHACSLSCHAPSHACSLSCMLPLNTRCPPLQVPDVRFFKHTGDVHKVPFEGMEGTAAYIPPEMFQKQVRRRIDSRVYYVPTASILSSSRTILRHVNGIHVNGIHVNGIRVHSANYRSLASSARTSSRPPPTHTPHATRSLTHQIRALTHPLTHPLLPRSSHSHRHTISPMVSRWTSGRWASCSTRCWWGTRHSTRPAIA
jgi:hypothetical protein